jgi:hypothetical protein
LHETSLHDITACLHIGHLVEIPKEYLAKRATKGMTHGYHECGQAGHWSRTALARSLLQKDWVAQEGACWEPDQGAMRVAVSWEGLPRPRATTWPWRVAQEEESEDTWGMLQQPTVGMCCLPALVSSGTLREGSRGLHPLQPC